MRHPIGTGALIIAGLLAPPLARAFSCANTPIGMVDCPDDQRVNGELGDAELWLVEDVTTEYFIGWGTDGGGVDFCCEAPTRNQGCTVEGTANHDFISLQSGSVTVHQSCTVYGYGADDALIGSTDPSVVDVMYGGTGDDTVRGFAGMDTLNGGEGDDTLDGGDGNDSLYGDAGIDTMNGGDGDDTMWGGSERDIMYGESGHDTMHGEGGADDMLGGDGEDVMDGGNEADRMKGGPLDDIMAGGSGDDQMCGNYGADDINSGAGDDEVWGGAGGASEVIDCGSHIDGDLGGGSTGSVSDCEDMMTLTSCPW